MFNKKTTALIAAGLLIFAMLASGGCLGDSDSSSTKFGKMTLLGKTAVSDADTETLKAENVALETYSKEKLAQSRAAIVSQMSELTDEQKADLKEMFTEQKAAIVSIYEPQSSAEVTEFKEMLFGDSDKNRAIINEDALMPDVDDDEAEHANLRMYSVMKDAKGNVHSFAVVRNDLNTTLPAFRRDDSICKSCVNEDKKTVRYNDKLGCYELVSYEIVAATKDEKTGEIIEPEYVKEKSIELLKNAGTDIEVTASDSKLTATLGGTEYDCVCVETKNMAYLLTAQEGSSHTHELYTVELKADEDTPKTGKLTDEEKTALSKKTAIKLFVKWMRSDRIKALQLAAQPKPQTLFEKFVAFAKGLFMHEGIAFADDEKVNLFEVAKAYTGQVCKVFDNLPGFSTCVNTYVYAVHEFKDTDNVDGGNDLYYITQYCTFTNDLEKTYYKDHWYEHSDYYSHIAECNGASARYWPNGAECDEGYVSKYVVSVQLDNNSPYFVTCHDAQPQTTNRVTQMSVSHGWNIGGGFEGGTESDAPKIAVSLSGGYESSESETYETSDVENRLYEKSSTNGNIREEYIVTRCPERDSTWTKLTYPCEIATSTYSPVQKFIWQMPTAKRSEYKSYSITAKADISGAYSKYSGSQNPQYYTMTASVKGDIYFVYPPRFCLNKDTINFDESTARTDYITVYSQGAWQWNESECPDWLEVTWSSTNKQLTIVADPNTSGKTRTFVMQLQRTGGTEDFDSRTITITQSKNSN